MYNYITIIIQKYFLTIKAKNPSSITNTTHSQTVRFNTEVNSTEIFERILCAKLRAVICGPKRR